ncbi:hypothetical protein N825_00205 [Skermanella stibiiresistens SB22]|uniref:Uncharacterized protein n=1 Tax=Skermanella stibiiresistens SB22 TaxID=1385369 RepID=W9HDH8_9PROT|nr:hypothetical protein [Skermanella stibiiresistens]EWY42776.1 hypothetical protein N825_00205 [Skermanella stibiiresistens SB22]
MVLTRVRELADTLPRHAAEAQSSAEADGLNHPLTERVTAVMATRADLRARMLAG